MQLFINGRKMDLDEDYAISKTLQVNDIGSLNTREASFTSKIKLPLTAANRLALDFLGSGGNQSNIPYQRNVATLLDNSGESVIYNGWADFDEMTNKEYPVTIYDGIIDFYKGIENKNLTDIGLGDLNHLKNLQTVIGSFSANTPYRYIVADYNGKTTYMNTGSTSGFTFLNVDYLIPSAKVSFIWDKIFQFANFTYEGAVFETEAFQNLWLTYPKPVPSTNQAVDNINTQTFNGCLTFTQTFPTETGVAYATVYESTILQDCFTSSAATSVAQTDGNCRAIEVDEDGLYRFVLNGAVSFPENANANWGIGLMRLNTVTNAVTWEVVVDNLGTYSELDNLTYSFTMTDEERVGLHFMNFQYGNIPYSPNSFWQPNQFVAGNFTVGFSQVLGDVVNFDEALIEFKIKDFVNEIMQRFCLTMFKHKYERKFTFLTLSELLQTDNVERWDEDVEIVKEEYAYGNYSQRNLFTYRYNEDNDSTYDGAITISNPNLKDENVVISSKFYAPEIYFPQRFIFDRAFKVYKFWNREAKTDEDEQGKEITTIEYKPLDKRFYLLRSEPFHFAHSFRMGSQVFGQWQLLPASLTVPVENYHRLGMDEIIEDYYAPMESILNRSKVITVNKDFSTKEIVDFDFRKLVYIDKLGEYYFINKVNNWVEGKPTKTELVNVKYFSLQEGGDNGGGTNPTDPITEFAITNVVQEGCSVTVTFTTDATFPILLHVIATPVFSVFGGVQDFPFWLPDPTDSVTFDISGLGMWGGYNFNLSVSMLGQTANSPNYPFTIDTC